MNKHKQRLLNLHDQHIRGTKAKSIVADKTILVCYLTKIVSKFFYFEEAVYTNSKVLKHLYDKKPAEEYECIIRYLHDIVRYPDHIYDNQSSKRGDYAFTKLNKGELYY